MSAAVHLRFQPNTRFTPHVQRTYAFGAVCLVRREGHQIHFKRLQVNQNLAGRLRRIHMKQNTLVAANFTDGSDVLDHADFIVHHHDGHQYRVRAQGCLKLLKIEQAIRFRVEVSRGKTFAFKFAYCVDHRLMLDAHGDDMFALALIEMCRALDGEVVRFSRPRSPDDFLGIGIDQGRNLFTRQLNRRIGFPAKRMRTAGRIAKFLGQIRNHFIGHTRVNRRGGRIVHVNW